MAQYEAIDGKPVLGIDRGLIVFAAKVLGRYISDIRGQLCFHVRTWEAGRGESDLDLTPAEFATWRHSFEVPTSTN